MSVYRQYLDQVRKVAHLGPKSPNLYNYHLLQSNPWKPKQLLIKDNFLASKSAEYTRLIGDKIPIPTVLKRHLLAEHTIDKPNQNKILGFKIEAKGRTGSRSMRRSLSYGMLNSGKVGMFGSLLDYGFANYTTKRGATGVKVWINYAK